MSIPEETKIVLDELPFSVRARVAMQLGRESISDSIVAILELIKNAYDADAENISLYFCNLKSNEPLLIIEDDGIGMTEQQFRSSWMVIGVDYKASNRRSNKNRAFIGEKGLGRLGLDRLCRITSIQTFSEQENTGLELVINWDKYEESKFRLEEVKHTLYQLPQKTLRDPESDEEYDKPHGTRLVLMNLKDNWDSNNLGRLQSQLSLLVSPFSGINDFKITLHNEGEAIEIASEPILDVAEWTLNSTLLKQKNKRGEDEWRIEHSMKSREGIEYYTYSGNWAETFPKTNRNFPECGPLKFVMYFIPRKEVEDEDENLSFERPQIKRFMDANQGIRIYRDNFRVKPYGEPSGDGDWLNLSYYRVQHPGGRGKRGWRVANNQVVGAIFIEREQNIQLLDQTNREGLVMGVGYDDLLLFSRHAIDWFEKKDTQYIQLFGNEKNVEKVKEEAQNKAEEATEAFNELKSTIDTLFESLTTVESNQTNPEPKAVREQLQRAVSKVNKTLQDANNAQKKIGRLYEEKTQELEQEKDTLAHLASLGILSVAFGHETIRYSNLVRVNTKNVQKSLLHILPSKYPDKDELVRVGLNDVEFGAERIQTFADFTLRYVRRDKRKEVKVYLSKILNETLDTFGSIIQQEYNINIKREIQELEPIRGFLIDWESILINFLTNSIWALENMLKDNKIIQIQLYQKDSTIHFIFSDSGCGIAKDTIDHIFEPTFSTKRDKQGRSTGTGMGLYIIDNIIKSYGGTIKAISPSDLGGAQFHIQIPYIIDNRGNR